MSRVAAFMDDLFFQMKLAETAKHLGIEVKVATNADAFFSIVDPPTKLVVVDPPEPGDVRATGLDTAPAGGTHHAEVDADPNNCDSKLESSRHFVS